MKGKWFLMLALVLVAAIMTGCAGTIVVVNPTAAPTQEAAVNETAQSPAAQGALRTGLAIIANAKAENAASVEYDVSVAAVTVDEAGVITACTIDSLNPKVTIDATGAITSDIQAPVSTKTELGDSYGMKAYAGAAYEWYEQAASLAAYAVGKTVEELKTGAVDENGKAPAGSDLAATATISIGGYVDAIEKAVANASVLGAQSGDTLRLAVISGLTDSKAATADKEGVAQLNCDVVALTENGGVITSCVIDSVQAKVGFDAAGTIAALSLPFQTKTELGEGYGMKAYAGAKYEWNEQAASFASYVTGKTVEQVAGIAVTDGKPADADLSATVTISIGGFTALIEKAMA